MRILVADDEETIVNSYKLILESRNHEVVLTYDGDQCLQTFNTHNNKMNKKGKKLLSNPTPFDLVILDYRMPKKNGLEVAQDILSIVPKQRIIIASAYSHELTKSPTWNNNDVEMLQKPFEFDVFVKLVEKGTESGGGETQKSASLNISPLFFLGGWRGQALSENPMINLPDLSERFWLRW